jgi:CubicO group peptidase (beta-lactamase class C family)
MEISRLARVAFVLAVSLALAGLAPAQKKSKKKDAAAEAGTVVAGEVGAALDRYMGSTRKFPGGFSGCALVAKKGEVLLEKGYGIADLDKGTPIRGDMLWDWCSVTKQFTAAAILKLEMQRKLSLEDPLSEFFRGIPEDKADVPLRTLLDHTSGLANTGDLPRDGSVFDREAFVGAMLALPVANEPGKKWEYNNMAYFIAAAIVEKVSGKPFERYCAENLFEPAKLETACMIGDPKLDLARVPRDERGKGETFQYGERLSWGYRGAGGAVMSCRDMLRWHQALLGDKVLDAAAKKKYYAVGLQGYALGWEVSRDTGKLVYSHSGRTGDIVTYYLRQMDDDVVVALAFNYDPEGHPGGHAQALERIARTGKAPDDL